MPQGQGSLRPGLAIVVVTFEPGRTLPLNRDLLADATFRRRHAACGLPLRDGLEEIGDSRFPHVSYDFHDDQVIVEKKRKRQRA
jgi:hypothetical protein